MDHNLLTEEHLQYGAPVSHFQSREDETIVPSRSLSCGVAPQPARGRQQQQKQPIALDLVDLDPETEIRRVEEELTRIYGLWPTMTKEQRLEVYAKIAQLELIMDGLMKLRTSTANSRSSSTLLGAGTSMHLTSRSPDPRREGSLHRSSSPSSSIVGAEQMHSRQMKRPPSFEVMGSSTTSELDIASASVSSLHMPSSPVTLREIVSSLAGGGFNTMPILSENTAVLGRRLDTPSTSASASTPTRANSPANAVKSHAPLLARDSKYYVNKPAAAVTTTSTTAAGTASSASNAKASKPARTQTRTVQVHLVTEKEATLTIPIPQQGLGSGAAAPQTPTKGGGSPTPFSRANSGVGPRLIGGRVGPKAISSVLQDMQSQRAW
jgi:hypothetical protein